MLDLTEGVRAAIRRQVFQQLGAPGAMPAIGGDFPNHAADDDILEDEIVAAAPVIRRALENRPAPLRSYGRSISRPLRSVARQPG